MLDTEEYGLFTIQQQIPGSSVDSLTTVLKINGKLLTMEIDAGSAVSIISELTYKAIFGSNATQLQGTDIKLCTYRPILRPGSVFQNHVIVMATAFCHFLRGL